MKRLKDLLWMIVFILITFILLSPLTNKMYLDFNNLHPFLTGYIKFSVLATMGEMLASRLENKDWIKVKGLFAKMLVWGIIGMIITFMFQLFPLGIRAMIDNGIIYGGVGIVGLLVFAVYNSFIANFAFGPLFMAVHRISDTFIEMKVDQKNPTIMKAIREIDWPNFMKVVVCKMIPLFWIPAHIITFLLPSEYRILFVAYLSIVLGILMVVAKGKSQNEGRV